MFGLFALFACAGTHMIDKKRKRILGDAQWQAIAQNTASFPLASKSLWKGRFKITKGDLAGFIFGLVLYSGFLHGHQALFGIMPLPPLP